MTLTVVMPGTQHNVIPSKCTMLVQYTNEFYDNEEVYKFICQHRRAR